MTGESSVVVSVVVPTYNSDSTLRPCLKSVREQDCPTELVVVDNYSSDNTATIAREIADVFVEAGPERSAQRNLGARMTKTPIVGFVDSDMVLGNGLLQEVIELITCGAASVIIPEVTVGAGFWARVSAYERSFYHGNDDVEAARFFARRVFEEAGGFDESMTGAEDWDLTIRTRSAGRVGRTQAFIVHDEGLVRYFSLCRKKAYYAPGIAIFLNKHGTRRLAKALNRPWLRPRALLRPLGIGLLVLKAGEAMGVCIGIIGNRLKVN